MKTIESSRIEVKDLIEGLKSLNSFELSAVDIQDILVALSDQRAFKSGMTESLASPYGKSFDDLVVTIASKYVSEAMDGELEDFYAYILSDGTNSLARICEAYLKLTTVPFLYRPDFFNDLFNDPIDPKKNRIEDCFSVIRQASDAYQASGELQEEWKAYIFELFNFTDDGGRSFEERFTTEDLFNLLEFYRACKYATGEQRDDGWVLPRKPTMKILGLTFDELLAAVSLYRTINPTDSKR